MNNKSLQKNDTSIFDKSSVIHNKAIRHSTRVRFLKYFLPFISFLVIALIFTWPFVSMQDSSQIIHLSEEHEKVIKKNKVLNPKLISRDKRGQIFIIKSLHAEHSAKDITSFDQPSSHLKMVNGNNITTSSDRAVFDKFNNTMEYSGNVKLECDDNYAIHTSKATQKIKGQSIQGEKPVQAASKSCNIYADQGFYSTSQNIKFEGNVRLVITNKAAKESDV